MKTKSRGKRWERLIASVKADAARRRVTLITLSVKDMEDTARRLTAKELRNVWFAFSGLSLLRLALPDTETGTTGKSGADSRT